MERSLRQTAYRMLPGILLRLFSLSVSLLPLSLSFARVLSLYMKDGHTPLYIAALQGHASVTKQLIEARCNIGLPEAGKGGVQALLAAIAVVVEC